MALEAGLAAVVVLAPLPFGAVVPGGRLALECGAFLLLAVWGARAIRVAPPIPPRGCLWGIAALLAFTVAQAIPLGGTLSGMVSPLSARVRSESLAAGPAAAAERDALGVDPAELERPASISLDPEGTASALRTGAALAALLVVATTVVAVRGPDTLALALLLSAAFQGLYGVLVLASGEPRIWHVPKVHYLDCATGTFVNRNHFAGYLEAALPAGLALLVARARRRERPADVRGRIAEMFGAGGGRVLLLGVLLAIGVSGLLLSFSRAGITLGIFALLAVALGTGRRSIGARTLGLALVISFAAVPLVQIGAERLLARYAETGEELSAPGGRLGVWKDTARMIATAPAIGVGFGAFEAAYPVFRSPAIRSRFEHAHNDLLQALAEGGAVGAALFALALAAVGRATFRALVGASGTVATGFAAGLTALALHGLVDFNFHIPSNAALAAILAGALLGSAWNRDV